MAQADALRVFISKLEKPISVALAGETPNARRVRLLEDVVRRGRMFDKSGLRIRTANGVEPAHWALIPQLEEQLAAARRDLKIERGDF